MELAIRPETPADYPLIADIVRSAFKKDKEVGLVEKLRLEPGFDARLSLVGCLEGTPCAHILFSPLKTSLPGGSLVDCLALAPLAVHPKFQRQGIGSRLVEEGLETARRLGWQSVFVVGDPSYYRRFGFQPAGPGIENDLGITGAVFMYSECGPATLATAGQAMVRYPPPFHNL